MKCPETGHWIGEETAPGCALTQTGRLTTTIIRGDDHGYRPFYGEGPFGPKSSPDNGDPTEVCEPRQGTGPTPQAPPPRLPLPLKAPLQPAYPGRR